MKARTILVALAASLLLPATARAQDVTTVSFSGGVLTITGTAAPDTISVSTGFSGQLMVVDANHDVRLAPGGGGGACTDSPSDYVNDSVECSAGSVTATSVALGAGSDAYQDEIDGIADTVDGGPGDDILRGAIGTTDPAADTLDGGANNDLLEAGTGSGTVCRGGDGNDLITCSDAPAGATTTLDGGAGNDDIRGGESSDTITGGDGDDSLRGAGGADDISGGAGTDDVNDVYPQGVAVRWSLDDSPDDGASGERDNFRSDIETVVGSSSNDTIVGSAGPNTLDGNIGNDTILGGAGDDVISGGVGDDSINPGAGADRADGGNENDVIAAADGEVDTINCSSGTDAVEVDAGDLTTGCESIRKASGGSGGTGGGSTPAPAAGTAVILPAAASLKGRRATFSVAVPGPGRLTATVTAGGRRLGRASRTARRAGRLAISVKLTGRNARKLQRKKRFKVKLRTVFTPAGGRAAAPVARTVKVKRS